MIPKRMDAFLQEKLPKGTWENRLTCQNGLCFVEFGPNDLDRLAKLGITVDSLGPQLVVCLWDENSPYEIGGYLVIDNLAMGQPAIGGIRMLPDVTPSTIFHRARGMTLKNAAADLPFGGGKAGVVAERSLTPREHTEVVRGFAHLLYRYHDIFIPGPDVGTNDADMKTLAIEVGLDNVVSKPADMGGNRVDQLGAGAGGVIIALQALLEELPRLKKLPQFSKLEILEPEALSVIIQGFGAVGAHTARILTERIPGAKVVGISDAMGYLFDERGLPVNILFTIWQESGQVTHEFFKEYLEPANRVKAHKFSNAPNDLLRESAFCLIPAAPISNYLDVDSSTQPTVTVAKMGEWSVVIEAANIYSPQPARVAARKRLEREVYRNRGVLIATDYLVNSGGVIFAAQEKLIKTPPNLRTPDEILGDRLAVEKWLMDHSGELSGLAEKRRIAAEKYREEVIRRNIHEFIDLLISDPDMLPCEAAESISIRRISGKEKDRKATDLMIPIPSIEIGKTVRDAAISLVQANSPILAVVSTEGLMVGVVTEWDITRATALGAPDDQKLDEIMSKEAITVGMHDTIYETLQKFEHYGVSALPVVESGQVRGMITSDLLARRSLIWLGQ